MGNVFSKEDMALLRRHIEMDGTLRVVSTREVTGDDYLAFLVAPKRKGDTITNESYPFEFSFFETGGSDGSIWIAIDFPEATRLVSDLAVDGNDLDIRAFLGAVENVTGGKTEFMECDDGVVHYKLVLPRGFSRMIPPIGSVVAVSLKTGTLDFVIDMADIRGIVCRGAEEWKHLSHNSAVQPEGMEFSFPVSTNPKAPKN